MEHPLFYWRAPSDSHAFPAPYWSNTSSNSIVRDLVEKLDDDEGALQEQLELLLNRGTIERPIHEDITYDSIYDTEDNLWNFLFFTGYLKKISSRMEGESQYAAMAIPNSEVSYIYRNTIRTWFDKKQKEFNMSPLYAAIDQGDTDKMEEEISAFLEESISYFDYGESYYHGFLTGLLQRNGKYRILSNREAGLGRADIILKTPMMVCSYLSTSYSELFEGKQHCLVIYHITVFVAALECCVNK